VVFRLCSYRIMVLIIHVSIRTQTSRNENHDFYLVVLLINQQFAIVLCIHILFTSGYTTLLDFPRYSRVFPYSLCALSSEYMFESTRKSLQTKLPLCISFKLVDFSYMQLQLTHAVELSEGCGFSDLISELWVVQ
jgi:hypothetical protein